MNILFDTNVILDGLLDRAPFGYEAAQLFNAVESSEINGYLSADAATTIFFLVKKYKNKAFALETLSLVLKIFEPAAVNRAVLEQALTSGFSDFEDAVVYQSALSVNADGIVTRNPKHFKKSTIHVYSPKELLAALEKK